MNHEPPSKSRVRFHVLSLAVALLLAVIARSAHAEDTASDAAPDPTPRAPTIAEEPSTAPGPTRPIPMLAPGTQVATMPSRPAAAPKRDESSWKFSYHGYLRAPMRLGVGKRIESDLPPGYELDGSKTTLHEATVPDDQALSFSATQHNPRSWAEGFFSFGNELATGTLGLGSYNLTEGGFNDVQANWGIMQAYVTLTPSLPWEGFRLWAKAGAIVDKYGMPGRYDSGEYDLYMFGRTHVLGETTHTEFDLTPAWTLYFEQGFGSHKPDPSAWNTARYTMLHHEHLGLKKGRDLEFGLHYLMSWSQEEYRPSGQSASPVDLAPRNGLPPGHYWVAGAEARAELGAFGYLYGAYSHAGADYAVTVSRAIEALSTSGGGEFDLGITSNYLDSPNCLKALNPNNPSVMQGAPENWAPLRPRGCSDGNGSVNALGAQYEFSLTNFKQQISGGQRFWGAGQDLVLKLYTLIAFVDSAARDTTVVSKNVGSTDSPSADFYNATKAGYQTTKLKYGADVTAQIVPWLSAGLRFDRVEPEKALPEQNFMVLSPRLSFKSQWVTHERLTIGYSRYMYAQRTCEPVNVTSPSGAMVPNPDPLSQWRCARPAPSPVPYDGFGTTTGKQLPDTRATGVTRPDENVFKIEATMWW
ncbi:MAG TPA: hypothetical protein VFV94_13515 [Polyangiaceae bacterium]|nr:hypothetical protein [Polyangiaceae bacterium]